ncbi:MarR family winged helix-turn-helix transcriptional regulator [Photobacterium sp. 1_MG-2023]|uniref:MarR family winged helix-turn-helix transcriptional regulator n=1 Tax=Photobacterium sp. 1_MG-2023 TaxID=3062646 RepID=UPI0026E1EF4D|nr:MarR family transcriptional regulator [Photobacterium sp. 1_MG-2023]MDO6708108.1 MarR family transcriptional regulator [Photobacterium sp. 1_MG-2023]
MTKTVFINSPSDQPCESDSAMHLYQQMVSIVSYINRLKQIELKYHQITPNEFAILDALQKHSTEGYMTPSGLAYYTDVTTGTITGRLDSLVSKALICRDADPIDRRSVRIQLTEKGQESALQYQEALNQICKRTFHSLSQAELSRVLSQISLALKAF